MAVAGARSHRSTVTAVNFPLCILLLSLPCAVFSVEYTSTSTLIRKCCPPNQQLNSQLDNCITYPKSSGPPAGTETESVSSLVQRSGDNFPWWMNADTPVYDPVTGNKTSRPFLKDQHMSAIIRYGTEPPCPRNMAKWFTWNSRSRYKLLANGTLLIKSDNDKSPNIPLTPDEYCVDHVDIPDIDHAFVTCPCNRTVCINKCCGRFEELNVEVHRKFLDPTCRTRDNDHNMWKPEFYSSNQTKTVQYFVLDTLFPTCDSGSELVVQNYDMSSKENRILLQSNGSAVMEGYGHGIAMPPSRWCGDTSVVTGNWRVNNSLICLMKTVGRRNPVASMLYGSLFMVSSMFLLATLVVYALLPDMRRSAHAKALLCHVAALLVGSLALGTSQLRGAVDTRSECHAVAFLIQYSMLATFFWLNTVCFDVAWTFRKIIPANVNNTRENKKFLYYSLYAWGCPAIISIITAVLEFSEDIPNSIIKPDIAKRNCWFYKLPAQLAYFYGPIAVLLLANIIMYSYTAAKLIRARRDTAFVDTASGINRNGTSGGNDIDRNGTSGGNDINRNSTSGGNGINRKGTSGGNGINRNGTSGRSGTSRRYDGGGDVTGATRARSVLGNKRERMILHMKLFLLMGVTWVMECVSAVVGLNDAYWYLSDSVNILRGVFVFIIFCCKKDVLRRLRERLQGNWALMNKVLKVKGKGSKGNGSEIIDTGHLGPAALEEDSRRGSSHAGGGSPSNSTSVTTLTLTPIGAA